MGGIFSGFLIPTAASSSFGSGDVVFLWLLDRFLFDVPGGSSHNLTLGMNGICLACSTTMTISGEIVVVSSMMGIGEGISMHDFATVLVLEIEITIICE